MAMIMWFFMFSFILPIRFYTSYLTKLLVHSNSIAIPLSFICFFRYSSQRFFWFFCLFIILYILCGWLFSCNCLLLFNSNFFIFRNFFSFFTFCRLKQALLSNHFFHSYSLKLLLKLLRYFNWIFLINGMLMDNWSRDRSLNLKFSV